MKLFFKQLLATVLGIVISVIITVSLFAIIILVIISTSSDSDKIKKQSVLHLKLDAQIVDRANDELFELTDLLRVSDDRQLGLNLILQAIDKAQDDNRIAGIYIDTQFLQTGTASVDEIRDALLKFKKESGKFVVSYANIYTQKAYYLASVADEIYLNPQGNFLFRGLSSQRMFYKKMLQKIGVEPIIIRHGKFKSAIEPFLLDSMSAESRLQTKRYLNSIWQQILINISEQRNINQERLNQFADSLLAKSPQLAVDFNFIDGLKYDDEIQDILKEKTGIKADEKVRFVSLSNYFEEIELDKELVVEKDEKIAVIYAEGEIVMGGGDTDEVGEKRFIKALRKARTDKTIKAVVLRINSPGGSALASENIWREVVLTKKEKPLVVSMGNVAASGGYYIACAADKVIANKTTITGSIGVFGILFNIEELLNQKIGINVDRVTTNKYSDLGSPTRPMSAYEKQIIQESVDAVYDTFITHVANGRKLTKEEVDKIGQGRVWTGADAQKIGLVDDFGGLKDAINAASELCAIYDYKIIELPEQKDFFDQLMSGEMASIKEKIIEDELYQEYRYLKEIKRIKKQQGILMRIPYNIELE